VVSENETRPAVTVIGTNVVIDFGDHDTALAMMERVRFAPAIPPDLAAPDYEAMRMERHWPTPNHMRRVADALDTLTTGRYGDVLRWFADLADESLARRARIEEQP
jgi:hypothetical protein